MNEIIIKNGYGYILINSNTHGKFEIKIDIDDIDRCKPYTWGINKYCFPGSKEIFYVYTYLDGKIFFLHRYILEDYQSPSIDHINSDTTNNTKNNLQACDYSVNGMKKAIPKSNTSGHKGVFWCWHLKTPKWKAFMRIDYQYHHLGYFNTYEEAVMARREAENNFFNKKEKLNNFIK